MLVIFLFYVKWQDHYDLQNISTYICATITCKKTSSSNFTGGTSSKNDAIFFYKDKYV